MSNVIPFPQGGKSAIVREAASAASLPTIELPMDDNDTHPRDLTDAALAQHVEMARDGVELPYLLVAYEFEVSRRDEAALALLREQGEREAAVYPGVNAVAPPYPLKGETYRQFKERLDRDYPDRYIANGPAGPSDARNPWWVENGHMFRTPDPDEVLLKDDDDDDDDDDEPNWDPECDCGMCLAAADRYRAARKAKEDI
jgi:hypothetical protein